MRRANGYQILSFILACLGAAAWSSAVDLDVEAFRFAAIALMLTAAACAALSMRANRRERSKLVRHLRTAAMAIRPSQTEFNVTLVEAESFGAAVDCLIAAARAQSFDEQARIRELEIAVKAISLERDRAQAMVAELAGAVREVTPAAQPALKPGELPSIPLEVASPFAFLSTAHPHAAEKDDNVAVAAGLAQEVLRMKRDFISMVSHELRTPLASIRAYTEMLIDGEAIDEQSEREFYTVISTESSRLSQAIDNVLSLSRLEAGLVMPSLVITDLNSAVSEAVENVRSMAESKHLNFQFHRCDGQILTRGDARMLAQAITNLVSNAVKFTPLGGNVTVRTGWDAKRGKAQFEVEDTGPGLDPKDYAVFFDRSYTSEDEMGRRGGPGSGVGLVLAQQVVEAVHGGKMIIQSSPGKGCCVGFELETAEVAKRQPAEAEA